MLTPSSNIFLMRNILHLYNKSQNESVKDNLRKIVSPNDQLTLNCNGQVIVGKIFLITMFFVRALLRIYCITFIPSKGTPTEPVQIDEKPSGDETQRDNQCKHVGFFF